MPTYTSAEWRHWAQTSPYSWDRPHTSCSCFCTLSFWSDAFTACFLINRLPTRVLNMKTPIELLLDETPDYTFFKVFGCACWPHLRPYNDRKLEFRSKKCVFLGYSSLHKGYKCLHVPTNRVYISRDVVFDETVFPFSAMPQSSTTTPSLISLGSLIVCHAHIHITRMALLSANITI